MPVSLVRLMLRSPAFWDDSQAIPAGFGTPWELESIANFYVVSKGGNLPGYATLLSMVPQLNVTVTMTINTDADDFAWIRSIQSVLLPALNETLVSLQKNPPADPGPHYHDVIGEYVQVVQPGVTITVVIAIPLLPPSGFTARPLIITMLQNKQPIMNGFLDYVPQSDAPGQLLFRFSFPSSVVPESCFLQEVRQQHCMY